MWEESLLQSPYPIIATFYVNSPCVIMGRFNREEEWVNTEAIATDGIPLLRRASGGGAVYQDLNNLNYGIILNRIDFNRFNSRKLHLMSFFREIVVNAFAEGEIFLEQKGKSDIFLNGKKISGNSALIKKDRILFHGTILFKVDYSAMERFLPIPLNRDKTLSHRAFVTSLSAENVDLTMNDAKRLIVQKLKEMLSIERVEWIHVS